jgi:glycosyltransferase involved in cell wall biosynthesis
MKGLGVKFLRESFDIFTRQTFKDFNVIISDHSQNDDIKDLCDEYSQKFEIKYVKNSENIGSSSANLNNAIKHADGKIIKILFQDDFLFDEKSLEKTVANFDLETDKWLVSACEHSRDGKNFTRAFYPHYNPKMHLGKNTISSPSVLTIKNDPPLLFDENLIWLMDCDYYRRCYDVFGEPKILNTLTVVNRIGEHQVTKHLATRSVRNSELKYMIDKFGPEAGDVLLPKITLVSASSVRIKETVEALRKSMRGIKYAEVLFFTHEKITLDHLGIKVVNIPKLDYSGYSRFIAYELGQHIKTDFALIVQSDGYVLRPDRWNQEFLSYDYIGAPWLPNKHFTKRGINVRVGNGGFSLRSKKLLNILNDLNLPFTDGGTGFDHEDGIICAYYRHELEEAGIKFAPVDVAARFSHESDCAESVRKSFGFHGSKMALPKIFSPIKKLLRALKIRI